MGHWPKIRRGWASRCGSSSKGYIARGEATTESSTALTMAGIASKLWPLSTAQPPTGQGSLAEDLQLVTRKLGLSAESNDWTQLRALDDEGAMSQFLSHSSSFAWVRAQPQIRTLSTWRTPATVREL